LWLQWFISFFEKGNRDAYKNLEWSTILNYLIFASFHFS